MKIDLPGGKYVVAVSGGVDSMVLLDLLIKNKSDIVVAHLNHGIREDSAKDRQLVESVAKEHKVPFEFREAKLGTNASEAEARSARYQFLNEVQEKYKADAIITAHHQDDQLETAILNMLRGTGRKGISSLNSSKSLIRPLLGYTKKDIVEYAQANHLSWNEDSTNTDTKYLRNYVRHNLLNRFSNEERVQLLKNISDLEKINKELDEILNENLRNDELDRKWFISLPHEVAGEVLAAWLRKNEIRDFDRNLIEKLVVGLKVAKSGKSLDAKNGLTIKVAKNTLFIVG